MFSLLACSSAPIATRPSDPASAVEDVGTSPDRDLTERVFDLETIHSFAIEMAPAEWIDIRDNPSAENWYQATFRWDGITLEDIGIRAFGAGSQIAGKTPIKLSFDRFVEGQDLYGLEQLKLDNSSQDAGYMNERIGTAVLRAMDLPAARTGWVELSVNGEHAGFFVLMEPIDDQFLKRRFGNDDGPLYGTYDWHYGQGLNPITWGGPFDWYVPQTAVETDGSDILEILEIVATGTDEDLAEHLDLESFTGISVARSVMGAIDAFSADGNNFYLYNDSGYWRLIPWDLDADLGYPYYMANALTMDPRSPWLLSHARYNPVTGAVYSDPVLIRHEAMGADIDARVVDVMARGLVWAEVDADIVASAELIRPAVYDDVLDYDAAFDQRIPDLRLFLHARLSRLAGVDVADCDAAVDLGATGTVGYGALQVDRTDWGPGYSVAGEHSCHGLLAWAPSNVTITVTGGQLTGAVGLQDWMTQCGDGAVFRVEQSGVVLWRSGTVANYDPATPFAVDVAAGEVSLRVEAGAENGCDSAAWLDLRIR